MSAQQIVGIAVLNFFMRHITSKVISMMTLYALNIVCLIILLCVNYRITKALAGTGATLSTRYQITENIRTIRVLLPTVLCDALVSAVDVSGALFFGLEHVFQVSRCTEDHYISAFYGFTSKATRRLMFRYISTFKSRHITLKLLKSKALACSMGEVKPRTVPFSLTRSFSLSTKPW
ncbi:hypothetical protein COOONC_04710 [Cooperia oncophora]